MRVCGKRVLRIIFRSKGEEEQETGENYVIRNFVIYTLTYLLHGAEYYLKS
jgi:hypothetical protein